MNSGKYNIWIEAEQWPQEEWDIHNGNTDVIVEFNSGEFEMSFKNNLGENY